MARASARRPPAPRTRRASLTFLLPPHPPPTPPHPPAHPSCPPTYLSLQVAKLERGEKHDAAVALLRAVLETYTDVTRFPRCAWVCSVRGRLSHAAPPSTTGLCARPSSPSRSTSPPSLPPPPRPSTLQAGAPRRRGDCGRPA